MSALIKYAVAEIERRWLVDLEAVGSLEAVPFREIEDHYFPETGLRLRKVSAGGGDETVFKLCKKYGKSSPLSEAITNLYLTEAEHTLLCRGLAGLPVRKRRYAVAGGALDVYEQPFVWAIFERDFTSEAEALAYYPPGFVRREVSGDRAFSGAAIAAAAAWPPESGPCQPE